MAIARISYGYGYRRVGLGINNATDINAHCVQSDSLRKLGAE